VISVAEFDKHYTLFYGIEVRTLPQQPVNKIDSFERKNPLKDIWAYPFTRSVEIQTE